MNTFVYPFRVSERIVFAEIYFPKKAAYYGTIFKALSEGYEEDRVKDYLRENATALLEEMRDYPVLLDPIEYQGDVRSGERKYTVENALKRIEMYQSPFQGWSTYSVDGVFFSTRGKMYEEATQIVRIMVRFAKTKKYKDLRRNARRRECSDVLRSILHWVISRLGRIYEETGWSGAERELFLRNHTAWPAKKLAFAKRNFGTVAKEAQRWTDDCMLFLFGYLVRKFWTEGVLATGEKEEEIWVTSLFNANLNVIERIKGQYSKGEMHVARIDH